MQDSTGDIRQRWALIESLFHEALEFPADARSDFLDERCGGDVPLRAEVERLLKSHENAADFINPPAEGLLSSELSNELDLPVEGKQIGKYILKRVIASGGMGTVYEAEQENPKRSVAIKVMRGGVASRSVLRRFEHEAAVLGRLRHPAIAQVLEAGTHVDNGERLPYFAMEYIPEAKSITDYVSHHQLSTEERIRLFVKVCDAVHHGHQRGIIHRDLKPANILVDGSGRPKVIDFGVARVLDTDHKSTSMHTGVGQLIGTLTYMSPEQCTGSPHDIDTRSDVYALGVVLYEMLCGRLPYDVRNKAITEVAAMIQDQPPVRPSSFDKMLRGDLETITLKAIEKDREYRYQTAFEFADDLRHFLNREPIRARPPSMTYQLRMFARRNRVLVGSVIAFVLLVTVSAVVMTSLFFQKSAALNEIEKQRTIAEKNAQRAELMATQADENAAAERHERAKAETILRYLEEMLASANPEALENRDITVREVLDRFAPRVSTELESEPEVEVEIHNLIGNTYYGLGYYDRAERHARRAVALQETLDTDAPIYGDALSNLGAVLTTRGNLVEAEICFQKSIDVRTRAFGGESVIVARTMDNLAEVYRQLRRYQEADQLMSRSIEIYDLNGEVDPKIRAMSESSYGLILEERGRVDEAESRFLRALDYLDKVESGGSLSSATIQVNLASLYFSRGDLDLAEPLFNKALNTYEKLLGGEHIHVGHALNNLAVLYAEMGRFEEAVDYQRRVLEIYRRSLGGRHRYTATAMNNLGSSLVSLEKYEEAQPLLLETLDLRLMLLEPNNPEIAATVNSLSRIAMGTGDFEAAEDLVHEAICIQETSLPPGHLHLAGTYRLLGRILVQQERFEEAEAAYRQCLTVYQASRPDADPAVIQTRAELATVIATAGEKGRAIEELVSAHVVLRGDDGPTVALRSYLDEMLDEMTADDWKETGKVPPSSATVKADGQN